MQGLQDSMAAAWARNTLLGRLALLRAPLRRARAQVGTPLPPFIALISQQHATKAAHHPS